MRRQAVPFHSGAERLKKYRQGPYWGARFPEMQDQPAPPGKSAPDSAPPNPGQAADSGFFSRREFLRSAALAGAGGALASCDRPGDRDNPRALPPPKHAPRLAIIGCGGWAYSLAGWIRREQDAKRLPNIRCVVDIDRTRALILRDNLRDAGHDCVEYLDFDEMLAAESFDLDAVVIATPDWLHAPQAIACLEAGLDVYCATPMAHSLEAAEAMARAARDTERMLELAHEHRSDPTMRTTRDALLRRHRGIGTPLYYSGVWTRSRNSAMPLRPMPNEKRQRMAQAAGYGDMYEYCNWWIFPRYGFGLAACLLDHHIDQICWLLDGTPEKIAATGGVRIWTADNPLGTYHIPDMVAAQIEFARDPSLCPDNRPGVFQASIEVILGSTLTSRSAQLAGTDAVITAKGYGGEEAVVERASPHRENWVLDRDEAYRIRWAKMIEEGLIYRVASDVPWDARRPWDGQRPPSEPPPRWVRTPYEEQMIDRHGEDQWREYRSSPAFARVDPSYDIGEYRIAARLDQPPAMHQHFMNFLDAVRAGDAGLLRCPAEDGLRTFTALARIMESL